MERVVRLVVGGATSIAVARHLGTESFGLLAFALAITGLALPLVTLGMPSVLVRDFVTRQPWQRPYASALACQIPTALVAGLGGVIVLLWTRAAEPDVNSIAGLLFLLPILTTAVTPRAWLESQRASRVVATVGIVASLTSGGLRITGILTSQGIVWFAAANVTEAAIVFIGLSAATWRRARPHPRIADANLDDARRILRESAPLLVGGVAIAIYMTIDVVMLGLIRSNDDAGVYSTAVRISEAWYFIPLAVMSAARPRLSALLEADPTRYRVETGRLLRLLAALAYVGVLITLLLAGRLISTLFGPEFEQSATILRVHVLAAPFVFLGTGVSQAFVDTGLTRVAMWRAVAGAVVNVALNGWLIPRHGATGAAVATLVSYAMSGVLLNVVSPSTRWLFVEQVRALALLPRRRD